MTTCNCSPSGASAWIKEARLANTPVALGASAAVNAIVMLHVMLYPREMIYIYMVLPIPAAAFGLLYIFGDMFGMLGVSNSASVVSCMNVVCCHMQYVLT